MANSAITLQLTVTYSSESRPENTDTIQQAQKWLAAVQAKVEKSILNVNYLDRKENIWVSEK